MLSQNSWTNVILPMPDPPTGDCADRMHARQPRDEPALEAIAWINDNFPDPLPDWIADVNGDGVVYVSAFLDLLARWGSCP